MFTGLEIKVAAAAALAIALCLGLWAYDSHEQGIGAAKVTQDVQAGTIKAIAADAARAASVAEDQAGNLHEATIQNAARVADARAIADVAQRMRDDSVRRAAATASAAAASGSQSGLGARSDVVWRRLLDGAYQEADDSAADAADLAVTVRGLRTSGKLCVRDYASLKP